MFKLMGSLLLLCGTAGLGWVIKYETEHYAQNLVAFRDIFKMILNEMIHRKDMITEIIKKLSNRTEEPYSSMLLAIAGRMEASRELNFRDAWREESGIVCAQLKLRPKDTECITKAFEQCDGGDIHTQEIALQSVMDKLEYEIGAVRPECEKKGKMYLYLCLASGITGVILFL